MMGTVNMVEGNCEMAQSYRKEKVDGKRGVKDEKSANAEKNGPYLVRDGITTISEKMVQGADASVGRS